MQAFFKAVPVILAAVDHLQTVECPGFANWEFPLFDITAGEDFYAEVCYITLVTLV